jgi:hypothetical protein
MRRLLQIGKVIVLDTLGVLLIIISPLLGWLPGPGGIPLFLAGLGLLSINHKWAGRMLEKIKKEGFKFFQKVFADHPAVQALYDFLSAVLIFVGIYLINTYTKNLTLTFAIFCVLMGISLFIGNRKRTLAIINWAKNLKRR